MASTSATRLSISFKEKREICEEIESGKSQSIICKERKLKKSTVATIWKQKEKFISISGQLNRKRQRGSDFHDIEEALLQWFKVQRSANVPLNGPILQAKAIDFSKHFGYDNFKASSGWLDRFKVRNGIAFGKISGESASVDRSTVTEWLQTEWPRIHQSYSSKNIFNADEAGLFYRLTPDKTLHFKGEHCSGGKQSKERLTVLVCANMDGSEKRKLSVIGKFLNPRCFKNVKSLPVYYNANRKSWMTGELYEKELRRWDIELRKQRRKILLLVDNCPAHVVVQNLTNIEVSFFPPNVTSILQPMDQGVIHCFKLQYRRLLVNNLIENLDKKIVKTISMLDAIHWMHRAWISIKPETIRNCFHHAGLIKDEEGEEEEKESIDIIEETDDMDDLPLSEWIKKQGCDIQVDFTQFASADDDLLTSEMPSDSDIVSAIQEASQAVEIAANEIEEDDSEVVLEVIPTIQEAGHAALILTNFLNSRSDDDACKMFDHIANLQNYLNRCQVFIKRKQTKISEFMV